MRFLFNKGRFLIAGILPGAAGEYDIIDKDTKTYMEWMKSKKKDGETGWDRLKQMFQLE